MRAWQITALVFAMLAQVPAEAAPPVARIDHIIVGVSDLNRGVAEIERLTGVRAAPGGSHPGAGSRNALLSLGNDTYLELFAIDPAQTVPPELAAELGALKVPTPLGWAVATDTPAALEARLAAAGIALAPPVRGSRQRPDGKLLEWTIRGFPEPHHHLEPFTIVWQTPALHPSLNSPGGCRLVALRLADPEPNRLRTAVDALGVPVAVTKAATARLSVDLDCPKGRITLG